MNLIEALLDVLALIGIIVTGGFLVFFIGDLLLAVLDPNYSSIFKRKKNKKLDDKQKDNANVVLLDKNDEKTEDLSFLYDDKAPQQNTETKPVDEKTDDFKFDFGEDENKIVFNDFDSFNQIDDDAAKREEALITGKAFAQDDAMADLRAEEEAFKQERLRLIEDRQKANEKEEPAGDFKDIFVEDEDEDDLSGFNFDDKDESIEDLLKDIEKEPEEEEEIKPVVAEQIDESPEEKDVVIDETKEDDNKELLEEIEKLKSELDRVRKEASEAKAVTVIVPSQQESVMSLDECLAKLEVLKIRLKANEKEFKLAKKEYMPLYKIQKRLDKDKTKLRRKEALVAKQKVMLYGVNNIVDIDQDKAKKLAEDLDLLDGLRLSVGHCEDVMKQNEERFPLLEKAYKILLKENSDIKSDIENLEEVIKNLQDKKDGENQ